MINKHSKSVKIVLPAIVLATFTGIVGGCALSTPEVPESVPDSQGLGVIPALNLDSRGRALRGYDAVAYFEKGEAVTGETTWSVAWNGANWYFSSPENQAAFSEDPEKFAPRNGGYCTFGVVLSKKFDGDPTVWLVHNEELYVFLDEEVKAKFLQDISGNFERVRNNWPLIKDKLPGEL
ncbi:MAG: YHS domain-containing protein [Leptolyngbya sp. SIO1D8]|nr:YHS domain-containing protein [Leptolyngbya sp. SIO1D8]